MADIKLTDELAAVNVIIGNAGFAPINAFTDELNADIVEARQILAEVSLALQTSGWHFNL